MPAAMRMRAAARGARRLLEELAGSAELQVQSRPFSARLQGSLTAHADPGGAACAFYTGVLAELMTRYGGRPVSVQHSHCEARGADGCEWTARLVR